MGFCTELFHFQDLVPSVCRILHYFIDSYGDVSENNYHTSESGCREGIAAMVLSGTGVGSAEDGQLRLSFKSQFLVRTRNLLDNYF